jgi:transposase-like protein
MTLLKQYIKDNWNGRQFIKIATNASLKTQIEHQTSFLDGYYPNIKLKQRAFVLLNDLTEEQLPYCRCGCGRRASLNREPDKGFSKYFNEDCHRRAPKISDEALEKLSNKEWLFEQRIMLKKAIETIGDELGVSHVSVDRWLKKHGIKQLKISRIRNLEGYSVIDDKEKLVNLYDSGLTCQQIAEPLNVTRGAIARTLKSYGVKLRPSNSYERTVKKVSGEEQELIDFIGEIYKDEILTSNRSVLNGRELDIYLPKHNLAIEYNGLYSHSYKPWEERESLIKGPNYHLSKTVDCEKQNIQLIHIFSDEWNYKKEIVKSIIKSKLNLNEKIYARNCKIISVDYKIKNEFLDQNNIQGRDTSLIKIGLEYNNRLVAIMTFNKIKKVNFYEWEIVRFCSLKEINVVGGFSKLLDHFKNNYFTSILVSVDRRYSKGDVFFKSGFKLLREEEPNYAYVDKNYLTRFNEDNKLNCNKIYDCGNLIFGLH